ncbi:MAG: 16S rRNA (adenine(1518)-N(6)/adenine(1519)-N(6))-dimethyltransferase RsmA [Rhizobiaceae bacterium]
MTAIDGLPPLRDVIERFEIAPKKSLGQNFLLDLNLTSRVARTSGSLENADVIEIGPGPGGLTRALLMNGARSVTAIERDDRCVAALQEIAAHYPGRLTIVPDDALSVDINALCERLENPRIVANLPYNIGTELLLQWITGAQWPPKWQSLTLMFQKEVAERIVAKAGDDAYGRLGVLCGWRTNAELMFDISRLAFTPPPKVTSSVVYITPRPDPLDVPLQKLETVTKFAFGQRRKMLRQSIKPIGGQDLLDKAGIDGTRRAETLSVEEFVTLARLI